MSGLSDKKPPSPDDPLLSGSTMSAVALIASVGISVGAFILVSQDGKDQVVSRQYLSLPYGEGTARMPRYSTSGSAGTAVTIEAFSVGEQITPEALMLRYAFEDEMNGGGSNVAPKAKKQKKHMHVIGKGAYGRVVSAWDRNTGRKVSESLFV